MAPRRKAGISTAIAVAAAMVALFAAAQARADSRIAQAVDLLRLTSFEPTDEGLMLSFQIEEEEVARLGLEALDVYLRAHRPQLFSGLNFGIIRYQHARIAPRELRVTARPNTFNVLDVEVLADVIADQQKRELVCEMAGWKSQCEQRWVEQGTKTIATVRAAGEVQLSLREDGALSKKPLLAETFLRRIRGTLRLGGLAGMSLELDLDPPHRAEPIALGLPPEALQRLRALGELVVTGFRVAAAPERRIEVSASVAPAAQP